MIFHAILPVANIKSDSVQHRCIFVFSIYCLYSIETKHGDTVLGLIFLLCIVYYFFDFTVIKYIILLLYCISTLLSTVSFSY